MSLLTFLHQLADLQTAEELGGHMSGAEAVDHLSRAIGQARQCLAVEPRECLTADGLDVLSTCKTLLDESLLVHIYDDEQQIQPDCPYVAAIDAADRILSRYADT